jgi:hypothetical protein
MGEDSKTGTVRLKDRKPNFYWCKRTDKIYTIPGRYQRLRTMDPEGTRKAKDATMNSMRHEFKRLDEFKKWVRLTAVRTAATASAAAAAAAAAAADDTDAADRRLSSPTTIVTPTAVPTLAVLPPPTTTSPTTISPTVASVSHHLVSHHCLSHHLVSHHRASANKQFWFGLL